MPDDRLELVRRVLAELDERSLAALVFGGWAEELRGLIAPREHGDIDLLLLDPVDQDLDAFLESRVEIAAKRFSHKRAFIHSGVCVELFIARLEDGIYVTHFWDRLRWAWPADLVGEVDDLPVASARALVLYRESWPEIQAHRPSSGQDRP